eukprot:CAMPEP_0176135216 /NCGR_PEP_ID=MMETSP0120_2-20121206/68585_1 /TAXON_ID=160619 /ORGANISM="Kryptoperidinium foliaceum, Strain CCMP 1326" /LENGTH=34 /DNA_ID= /DNA_START= /DNA_END= /DNA_ORIENTATION=
MAEADDVRVRRPLAVGKDDPRHANAVRRLHIEVR